MVDRQPDFRTAERRDPVIREIANGIVVPIPAEIRTPQPPETGVLDAALAHVAESITWRGGNRWTFPPRIPAEHEIRAQPGSYMFAGLLYGHFGHFLVESTARLWALEMLGGKIDGIVFVPKVQVRLERVLQNYRPFFDLLEIGTPIVNLPEPTRFDRLFVPQQGFGMFGMIQGLPEYRDFMRSRMAASVTGDGTEKLYISRSDLPKKRGGLLGEKIIEQYLKDEGFRIFHPQKHSFHDQLAAYKSAGMIISPDGSPLHMAALVARPSTKIAVLARRPNIALQFRVQFRAFCNIESLIIDAISRHWIPSDADLPDRLSHGEPDLERVCHDLAAAGFIKPGSNWQGLGDPDRKKLLQDLEAHQGTKFKAYPQVPSS